MPMSRKGYKRPTQTKAVAPKKVFVALVGKNSPNAIIRLASGAPYKPAPKTRPMRKGRGLGRVR